MAVRTGGRQIHGDNRARILSKIDRSGGPDACWPFRGARTKWGYGNFYLEGRYLGAHRAAWLLLVGDIPEGLEVDHDCHNRDSGCLGGPACPHRMCANWQSHLRLRSHRENDLAGKSFSAVNSRKTHCPAGHPYDEANTYSGGSGRQCRVCHALREAERRERIRTDRW